MMETKEQKNESRTKEKKPLTEQQRQQRQKMLVYPLMVLLFAGCMWLIFAPSSEDKEKERQGQGFNTDMPMPEDSKIIGDKAKAYEQQDLENKRKERRGMVGDLSAFWNDSDGDTPTDDADTSDDYRLTRTETTDGETADERQAGIRTSAAAYQRLNTSLGTFYEPPKEDTEKEELRERIDELEAMLVAQDSKPSTMEEQVALLEKSYELAAKYQNDNNAGQAAQPDETGGSVSTGEKSMKAEPVSDVRRTVVSALPQPMTDSAFIADYSGERRETADERQAGIRTSAAAYQRLNTSLGTFYEPPKEDTEKEELRERIDELEAMLVAQDSKPSTMEEQVALLEKSYELAAKYQNDNNAGQAAQPDETGGSVSTGEKSMKAEPVSDVRRTVVSALPQPMTDSAFIADYSGERNYGFHTAIGAEETTGKNTIAACVQGDQTLTDGQTVKLRLLEPMRVSGRVIPRNTLLVGAARLQGERLGIGITSLEHGGNIIPVELEVYDSDGQAGIFIPGSMEIDAAKEIGANMGSSLGSSINISTDAGAQLASDLGRGAIQGISQYISKRMRTVKVHLKSGYRVLLYQEKE